ncbi:MAG: plasmid recombination protein [Phascolarctobacterium sp.]|nr:plasmid recombination protein [Phascolarctobacterium sp.]
MAHAMKHTKAACGHMFAHYDRSAENISNENIDRSKTHLNYNLAVHQQMDQGEFVRQRCSEVYCHNRKDVNVMASWVVTAPKDMPEHEYKQFFQSSYNFLCERYGKDNVVSAYVHMDESQPHLHFAFVPVVYDKKKDRLKVSAKVCVSRSDLQSFHTDLDNYLQKVFGRDVGVLNGATREGNLTMPQLKEQQAKADELAKQNAEAEARLNALKMPLEDVKELDVAKPTLGRYKAVDVKNMAHKAVAFEEMKGEYEIMNKHYNGLLSRHKQFMAEVEQVLADKDREIERLGAELEKNKLTPEQRIALASHRSLEDENRRLREKVRQYERQLGISKEHVRQR